MSGLQQSSDPALSGFDYRAFAITLRRALDSNPDSFRQLAPQMGVTISDLSRASRGQKVDIARMIAMAEFLRFDLMAFYQPPEKGFTCNGAAAEREGRAA